MRQPTKFDAHRGTASYGLTQCQSNILRMTLAEQHEKSGLGSVVIEVSAPLKIASNPHPTAVFGSSHT